MHKYMKYRISPKNSRIIVDDRGEEVVKYLGIYLADVEAICKAMNDSYYLKDKGGLKL